MAFSQTAKKMLLIDRKFLNLYHSCLKLLFSYITKIQSHQNIKIKPNINNSFRKNGFKNYIGKCE